MAVLIKKVTPLYPGTVLIAKKNLQLRSLGWHVVKWLIWPSVRLTQLL
jgi:hypothetical protein